MVRSPNGDVAKAVANGIAKAYIDALSKYNTEVLDSAQKELDANISDIDEQISKLEKALSSADPDALAQVQAVVGPARQALLDRREVQQSRIDNVALVKSVGTLGGAQVIQEADVKPSFMAVLTPILTGLLLGGFLGFLLVWIREGLSGRIVDASDLEPAGVRPRSTCPGPRRSSCPRFPRAMWPRSAPWPPPCGRR